MSNIDQAFINAYSDQAAAMPTEPTRASFAPRPAAPVSRTPTLRVFAHGTEQEPAGTRVDEPQAKLVAERAPHFVAPARNPGAAIAAQQQAAFAETEELALPSLVGERRPLSTFSTPRPAPSAAFKPVFEVDEFRWPAITDELLRTSRNLLLPVTDLLLAAAVEGRSLVGIAGTIAGVGASTVTMCLARLIAQTGHSIVVVDGNFARRNLGQTLGLEFGTGWDDVLAGQIPLAECAVASVADRITLMPLGRREDVASERLSSIQSSVIAGMLRYHHDVVLFDLGAASETAQLTVAKNILEHCRLDAGIIVAPSGAKDLATLHGIDQLSALFGPLCLGVIGNRAG